MTTVYYHPSNAEDPASNSGVQAFPSRRNEVAGYVGRFLDEVTDWRRYSGAGSQEAVRGTMGEITRRFFSAGQLKGMAFLLSAQLLQQGSASAVTMAARTFLRGSDQGTVYRGVRVTELAVWEWWRRLWWLPEGLRATIKPGEGYHFTEGGRTWLVMLWDVTLPQGGQRELCTLSLLGFPNRSYFYDRPVGPEAAIDVVRARITAESLPGHLGETGELDWLFPLLRVVKLVLLGLNWYLVDPVERDADEGPAVSGYNDIKPQGGPDTPWTPSGYPTERSGWRGGDGLGQPPPPPPPAQSSPYPPLTSAMNAPNPYPPGPGVGGLQLTPHPINQVLLLDRGNGRREEVRVSHDREAYLIWQQGRELGLGIVPGVALGHEGAVRLLSDEWTLVHLKNGFALNESGPLPSRESALALAGQLGFIDWRHDLSQIPPAHLSQAREIVARFVAGVGADNGYSTLNGFGH